MEILKNLIVFIFILNASSLYGQVLTQNIRGNIVDEDSRQPLIGAEIIIINSDPIIGTITDQDGNYELINVPIARVSVAASYLGYS